MLDLSVSDKLVIPPDTITGANFLEFIGFEPIEHSVYPVEAHIAEKLHAMTMTYDGERCGRVKDLVDIGLLAKKCTIRVHAPSPISHRDLRISQNTPAAITTVRTTRILGTSLRANVKRR